MDIIDQLADSGVEGAAKAEILRLRKLLIETLDSCDAVHEFGTDLYEEICRAVGKDA